MQHTTPNLPATHHNQSHHNMQYRTQTLQPKEADLSIHEHSFIPPKHGTMYTQCNTKSYTGYDVKSRHRNYVHS